MGTLESIQDCLDYRRIHTSASAILSFDPALFLFASPLRKDIHYRVAREEEENGERKKERREREIERKREGR